MNDTATPVLDDLASEDHAAMAKGVALGRATGILMERLGIDADAAFERLVDQARRRETTVLRCAIEIASLPAASPRLDAFHIKWLHGIELTERELEVLRLIVEGCTNAEIGERLYLGSETVKTYTKRLFAKLGVATRTQAAVWALRASCGPHFVVA